MTSTETSKLTHDVARLAPPAPQVIIIGGGIAGLSAAHAIAQHVPAARITLLESEGRLGGKILTERVDDFILETGPDSFLSSKARGLGLARELGINERLVSPAPRRQRASVLSRGTLQPLPEGLSGLVPTRLGPVFASSLLSPAGKVRFALDLAMPPRRDDADESLATFVRRRVGGDAYDRLIEPLMAGIYGGDGERLSLAATFPQLRAAERNHGSLIRGVLAAKRAAPAPATPAPPAFLTPSDGLGAFVTSLDRRLGKLGVEIRLRTAARAIRDDGKNGYVIDLANGMSVAADAVVVAAPAFVAGQMMADLNPELAGELLGIPHGSTAIVNIAIRRSQLPRPLENHGYIIPRIEQRPALAATFVSEKWPGRAPADYALIRVFLGRFGQEETLSGSDSELAALAWNELVETLGVTGQPAFSRVQRWSWGMPQYVLGHLERLDRIDTAIHRHPGLAVAGNAYRGVGLPDVIASGEAAASVIATHLRDSMPRRPEAVGAGPAAVASAPAPRG